MTRIRFAKGLSFGLAVILVIGLAGCISYNDPETTFTGEYLAGRLAARTHDHRTAADQFGKVHAEVPGSVELRKETFMFSLLTGDVDRAAEIATHLSRFATQDTDPLIPLTLAVDDMRHNRYASARAELSKLKDGAVYESGAFLLRAWAIAGDRGPEAGLDHLKNPPAKLFTGFNPLHQAFLAEKSGNLDEARAGYQLAFVTLGGSVGQRAFTAFLERQNDQPAIREANKLLMRRQGASRRLGQKNLERFESGRVSTEFQSLTSAEGGAIALHTLGTAITEQIYKQRDAASEAGFSLREPDLNQPLAFIQLALALDPDLPEANRFLGSLNNIYGQHNAAIEALSRVRPSSPFYEQSQIEISGALVAQDKDVAAVSLLNRLIKNDADADEARLVLSAIHVRNERYEEAVNVLGPAISSLPDTPQIDSWRFFIARADALLQVDRWEEAEVDLKRAVEIAPEEPGALNYLGYSWAERGVNLTEAFELLEKAREKNPRSGAITDSVGWAHYQLGQYDKAVLDLEKAVSLVPDDPTITDHLGDVYWKLGRKIEARYEWRRALDLEPPSKLKAVLKTKLETGLQDVIEQDANEESINEKDQPLIEKGPVF